MAGALYLLLIDITDLPELIVGAGAALLAALGFELTREQEIADLSAKIRWLGRLHKPLLKVPSDIAAVSFVALRQLRHPRATNGEFRAVNFRCTDNERLETGKWALAESFGSFAPNTIIVGVDPERELILGHQLRRSGATEAIDLLELG
jgi:hypothetical protein